MSKSKLAYFIHDGVDCLTLTVYENPRVRTLAEELARCTVENWGSEADAAKHCKRLAAMASLGATHTVDSQYGSPRLHVNFHKYGRDKETGSAAFDWGTGRYGVEQSITLAKRLEAAAHKRKELSLWESVANVTAVLTALGALQLGEFRGRGDDRYFSSYVLPFAAGGSLADKEYSLTATDSH